MRETRGNTTTPLDPAVTNFARQADTQRVVLQASLDKAARVEDNWYYSVYVGNVGRKITPEEYAMAQEFINLPDHIIQSFTLSINVPGGIILTGNQGEWYCDIEISDTIMGAAFTSDVNDTWYVEEVLENMPAVEAFITKHFIQPSTKEGQND